jgi:hypothetical protein
VRAAAASFLRKGDAEETAVLRAVQAQGVHARPRAADRGPVEARLSRRRGPLHLGGVRGVSQRSPRRAPRSTRTGASSARTSATSPPTSCCSARCSTTSTRCWACRRPSCICGRNRPGELDLANAREKAHLDAVVRRVLGPAAGPAREGAGVRHRQAADVHAAGSLRALAARRADGRPS